MNIGPETVQRERERERERRRLSVSEFINQTEAINLDHKIMMGHHQKPMRFFVLGPETVQTERDKEIVSEFVNQKQSVQNDGKSSKS